MRRPQMLRGFARAIVQRYPAAWRERYEAEVLDLLDSAPVRAFDVGELFRNMLVEQVRAIVDIEQPSEAATKLMRWKAVTVGVAIFLTLSTALLLRWWRPLVEPQLERVMGAAMIFWVALFGIWAVHTWRQRHRPKDERAQFPVWVAMICLPVHLTATTGWLWAGFSLVSAHSPWWLKSLQQLNHSMYLGGPVTAWLLMQIWPGQRLVRLLTEFQLADGAVNGAKAYIESCEEWIAKGVPSPLTDAKVALEQRIVERDAIRERLDKVGTRPRFLQAS